MSLIQCYGILWRRRDVNWHRSTRYGVLEGKNPRAKRANPVNFCDQTGIYVLYDGNEIVYVGQVKAVGTGLYGRLQQHTRDVLADRWDRFSWFGTRRVLAPSNRERPSDLSSDKQGHLVKTDVALNQLEGLLLAVVEPVLNKQGSRWKDYAIRFIQHRNEEDLGPSEQEMVHAIYEASQGWSA